MKDAELLAIIAQAEREGWTELDLSGKGLERLPIAIGRLQSLEKLILGKWDGKEGSKGNRLTAIPQEIFQLTNLKKLHLAYNQITAIPEAIANLANLTTLDLSSNQITAIPDAIANLANLTSLSLDSNQIKAIPDAIANLANLTSLDLSSNQIKAIPDAIANLVNLTTLWLGNNQITVIPDAIAQLANLTFLYLSENQITTIPDEIAQLANLTQLYLNNNQIAVIPDEIAQLVNLTQLFLSHNQLTVIPDEIADLANLKLLSLSDNQITVMPDSLVNLANLTTLHLYNNQITAIPDSLANLANLTELNLRNNPLPIPPEILNDYDNPKAIFDFWLERERQPLNEAKVILVGQGTVGKTSLVKRLLDNQFDTDERKTDGINIRHWQITTKNEQVKLRVWDFGGQEIMHATHQFFLTERSLYLLVIQTREDELANRIEYWLKLIESLGNQAPVIIVGNKIDDHPLDLDRHGLQTKYPNIKGFIGTSCATGLGISELKQKITAIIANEMPHVFDPIPVKWLNLKNKLEQDDRDYITYQEYEQKCIDTGITRESSRHTLVRLLHELGIVLNFTDDKRLKDTNVLNPEWVTVGAYRVINDNLLMTEHKGVLHWQDSARIFQPKSRKDRDDYPTEESRKFILRMMEKFELCFPMESYNHQDYPNYLIPDLLPKEEPDTGEWKDCLNFEYHYDKVLPNSVISRFIVKSHDLIARTNYRTYWRTGVILANKEGNKAYVKADLEDAKIFIHISGNSPTRRSFLSIIRHTFDQIHDRPKLTPDERVCLPDNPKESVSYDHLLKLEKRGKAEYSNSDRDYNIRELLDGIEDRRSRPKDDLREREMYSDQKSSVTVIINNSNQQATIMTEPEKPHPENLPKSDQVQFPSVIAASISFGFLFSTTAFLVLAFAGILNITQLIVAMFSIILLMTIAVIFVLKATGQMEGQSFENVILAVLKQATLYDAFLSKISDFFHKPKS